MKRTLCAVLSAVFLSMLAIPCAAADTAVPAVREYPGFSDVAEDSWCGAAVKLCYEAGLMNGISETAFYPQGGLSAAQLVVVAARLYDLRHGGSGTIPSLPDLSQPYLRLRDEEGTLLRAYTLTDAPVLNALEPDSLFLSLSDDPEDPSLPETCVLEVGFEDYGAVRRYPGTRESHETTPGTMSQGLSGTGYRIEGAQISRLCSFLGTTEEETLAAWQEAWWFPAAFYLSSQGLLNLHGELIYRLDPEGLYAGQDERLFSQTASRGLAAWLIDLAAGELETRSETVSIPDVDPETTADADAMVRLYQAGVLTGVDAAGNFAPGADLTRGQAAVILARVLDPALRITAPAA